MANYIDKDALITDLIKHKSQFNVQNTVQIAEQRWTRRKTMINNKLSVHLCGIHGYVYCNGECETCFRRITTASNTTSNTTADPLTIHIVPTVHGHWDDKRVAFYLKCSECGCCVRAFGGEVFLDYGQEWNYCPNCGAKMDEVNEEVDDGKDDN